MVSHPFNHLPVILLFYILVFTVRAPTFSVYPKSNGYVVARLSNECLIVSLVLVANGSSYVTLSSTISIGDTPFTPIFFYPTVYTLTIEAELRIRHECPER